MSDGHGHQHIYDFLLTEADPVCDQPASISLALKKHQLAALERAMVMERNVSFLMKDEIDLEEFNEGPEPDDAIEEYDISENVIEVHTNVGVIGDVVGYGKTLIALGIVASTPTRLISKKREYTYTGLNGIHGNNPSYFKMKYILPQFDSRPHTIQSTLVVVPRGPVFIQWKESIENHTTLRMACVDNIIFIRKSMPPSTCTFGELKTFFDGFDIVLIKSTTMDRLTEYYDCISSHDKRSRIRWARIMIDEAHNELLNTPYFLYDFIWLITSSYPSIPGQISRLRINKSQCITSTLRATANDTAMPFMLIKSHKTFIRQSFSLPEPIEFMYLCKTPMYLNAIRPFLTPHVIDLINANDICGAIRALGGNMQSEEGIVGLVTNDLIRAIHNKEVELGSLVSMDLVPEDREARQGFMRIEIDKLRTKLELLQERVSSIEQRDCAICISPLSDPIMLTCTHMFCGPCLMNWIKEKSKNEPQVPCPECRQTIECKNLVAIVKNDRVASHAGASTSASASAGTSQQTVEHVRPYDYDSLVRAIGRYTKEEMMIHLIKRTPDGKFLLFSRIDSSFRHLIEALRDHNITWAEMKGTTHVMANIQERFRAGEIKVILLNTHHAGSGIDMNMATDIIIYHQLGTIRTQAIGRAQRVGRTIPLRIHNLCLSQEMNGVRG